jgi:hypothetical protein
MSGIHWRMKLTFHSANVIAWLALITANLVGATAFRDQVEADWLLQEQERRLASRWMPNEATFWQDRIGAMLAACRQVARERQGQRISMKDALLAAESAASNLDPAVSAEKARRAFLDVRWALRQMLLTDPLLDFDEILITTRVPGVYNHMSDQYYGWWSRPGGGIHLLRGYREDNPQLRSITQSWREPGSFLRPTISQDGLRVLFAWARHYPGLIDEPNKEDKRNVPEDAFYHLYEMNLDGSDLQRLTHGKYDNFDARHLPDGRIVFCSTRRGQAVQAGVRSAHRSLECDDLPDMYVRCGGGPQRPVAVYTLHTMDRDGRDLTAISPFEMFEWEPSIAQDGTILYSRWDYVDRSNMPFMSLWSIQPDGANARLVYGNYTISPHCTFEPQSIPGSSKIVFTASGHHSQTMGSLVLLDPAIGTEGADPITRLTPEVAFPEIEGWPRTYYAHPWPLSERLYLVSWGVEDHVREGQRRASNGMGVYLYDAELGVLELLHRDPEISTMYPIPVRPRNLPPAIPAVADRTGPKVGRFLVSDVYRGLDGVKPGSIASLRVVGVPGKTQPVMNQPSLGITGDDPGKFILGTVPVEADGSAHFQVPSGVIVFFQALNAEGEAIQTMRSATYALPGQTVSCVGCHEPRNDAPPVQPALAAQREPSPLTAGPGGSWPLRFDALVQPVLDRNCMPCHDPAQNGAGASKLALNQAQAYHALIHFGRPSLHDEIWARYHEGKSIPGRAPSALSAWLAHVRKVGSHESVALNPADLERLISWLDTYGQRLGAFSEAQEKELMALREESLKLGILQFARRDAAELAEEPLSVIP